MYRREVAGSKEEGRRGLSRMGGTEYFVLRTVYSVLRPAGDMLFVVNYLLVALLCAGGAVWFQGWAWMLLWPAASFGAVSAGYMGLGPGIFGKQEDGGNSPLSTLFLLPYLAPYWGFYVLLIAVFERLRGENPFDSLVPGVLIGRRLAASELPAEVDRVFDFTCEYPEPPEIVSRVRYHSIPILDGAAPSVAELTEIIDRLDDWPGVTYVHCAIGHGRTGLVACGLLLKRGLAQDADEAFRLARECRPFIRLNATQRERLIEYHDALKAVRS